jgi:hypothetical protein
MYIVISGKLKNVQKSHRTNNHTNILKNGNEVRIIEWPLNYTDIVFYVSYLPMQFLRAKFLHGICTCVS